MEFCKWIDEQKPIAKVLLFFPDWGWVFSFLYRILIFANDSKRKTPLFGAFLFILGPIGFIFSIVEFVFIIIKGKPTILI